MAELKIPTAEELKKLSPSERKKRLRELEELRKQELEDAKKKIEQELKVREQEVQQQLAAAEALIEETQREEDEEEVDEALREAARRRQELERESESLEARVEQERPKQQEEMGPQYRTGNLYDLLERAADRLDELGQKRFWNDYDVQNYKQAKADIERAQQYQLSSDNLKAELGMAVDGLHKLLYRK